MKREFENNPMIIHLPDGIGILEDDLEINVIKIDFKLIKEKVFFTVCVNDFLFINKDYKFIDNEDKAAYFGQNSQLSNGKTKQYSSIDARAVSVITAIIEGKIRLSPEMNNFQE